MFLREVAKFHFVFSSAKERDNQPYITNPTGTQHKLNTQIYKQTMRLCEVYMTSAEAYKNAKTPNTTKQEKNVMVM